MPNGSRGVSGRYLCRSSDTLRQKLLGPEFKWKVLLHVICSKSCFSGAHFHRSHVPPGVAGVTSGPPTGWQPRPGPGIPDAVPAAPRRHSVGPRPSAHVPRQHAPALFQLWLPDDCWLHADSGLEPWGVEDPQPYCFSVLVGHGQSRRFSVELGSELAAWATSFQRATFMEVQRAGVSASRPAGTCAVPDAVRPSAACSGPTGLSRWSPLACVARPNGVLPGVHAGRGGDGSKPGCFASPRGARHVCREPRAFPPSPRRRGLPQSWLRGPMDGARVPGCCHGQVLGGPSWVPAILGRV